MLNALCTFSRYPKTVPKDLIIYTDIHEGSGDLVTLLDHILQQS